mgnify:CR=1 FL=1
MEGVTMQTVGTFGWWEVPQTPEMQDVGTLGWWAQEETETGTVKGSQTTAATLRRVSLAGRRP